MNYTGPTTTSNSSEEGRLKVDVNQKKKIIKKILKKQHEKR
jgi:hypothetical protein